MSKKGSHKQLMLSRSTYEFSDNFFHDLLPTKKKTGWFLSEHSLTAEDFETSPFSLDIKYVSQVKTFKREVYSFLSMIGDIGGLYDGLILLTGIFLRTYNVSLFELDLIKKMFAFQQTLTASPLKIQKVSKADLIQISQHFGSQQIL